MGYDKDEKKKPWPREMERKEEATESNSAQHMTGKKNKEDKEE